MWFRGGRVLSLILQIGNVNLPKEEGKVALTENLCHVVHDLNMLAEKIYPDLVNLKFQDTASLKERTTLSPKNDTAYSINNTLLEKLPTECVWYQSIDSVERTQFIPR
jgi:hypothetical protein